MRYPILIALLLTSAAWAAPPGDARADKIARFRKFMADPDAKNRADTIGLLEDLDDAEGVTLLMEGLKDRAYNVRDEAVRVLSHYRSDAALAALEKALASPGTGSKAQPFVALTLGRIGNPSSLSPLVTASESQDWELRRAVAEALGSFKDPASLSALARLAKDSEPVVRTTTADSLGKVGDAGAVDAVNALLADSVWQVKAAACAAAAQIRDKRSIPPLMQLLKEEGRIKLDARNALTRITTYKFDADFQKWDEWWQKSGPMFQVPGLQAPQAGAPAGGSSGKSAPATGKSPIKAGGIHASTGVEMPKYDGPGTHYYGINTPSKNMVFMLDVSRSMAEEVTVKPPATGGRKYASDVKIDIAKEELIKTIKEMKESVKFNIILFETEITTWKKDLVPANETTKAEAIAFITKQKPRGVEVAHNNRSGGSVGQSGRTNIFDALQHAFGVAGIGTYDKNYTTSVDTVFMLTDGQATAGKMTNEEDILAEVRRLNGLRRVVINTINIGKLQGPFLERLAQDNGGQFLDLVGSWAAPQK